MGTTTKAAVGAELDTRAVMWVLETVRRHDMDCERAARWLSDVSRCGIRDARMCVWHAFATVTQ